MRNLFLISILLFLVHSTWAQPEPCNPDKMTSTCLEACVVCDINGFTGRNNLTEQGQTFTGFCTSIFHNMSYIAFIAGTENLTLNVSVTNCTIGRGIEVGIFESLNCTTFVPVTACNTDVPSNGNATFSNIVPLVIGQYYYLIMDGSMGDICDWTFKVISGSTLVGALTSSGDIEGPKTLCPGLSATYSTIKKVGVTNLNWTVNGVAQNRNTADIDITFPSDGTYQLCVTASNVCDQAPPSCTTINVVSQESTHLVETICANDCIEVAGETVCQTGHYEYIISLPDGCDSMVYLDLTVTPEISSIIDINLCIGDTFLIGNTPHYTSGVFVETIQNAFGCDSTVTLTLAMIDCELSGILDFMNPICNGADNGTLLFSLLNGIPPFTYEWNHISKPSINGNGVINSLMDVLIENIPSGIYEINIKDSFGNDIVFIQEVVDPPVLTLNVNAYDYNGYNLSCFNSGDGSVAAIGNGGVPPYSFLWSTNDTEATISHLSAGEYEVELTDFSGCVVLGNINLSEPELLSFLVDYIDPNCDGPETGSVQLDSIWGGTPPYAFALNLSEYIASETFSSLGSGAYNYSVLDANSCFVDTTGTLYAPDIPVLFMDEDQEIDLGCSVLIGAETNNTSLIDISWTNFASSLTCDSCIETLANPVNDTKYILSITSIDECTTSDSIFVQVNKIRGVYIPNVFSPNGDGVNDYFFIQTNKSVLEITTFRIFDRWGGLMYNETNLAPNQESLGWDGKFNGEPLNAGVYVWMAEVTFLDGIVSLLGGDVTIIK